MHNELSKIVDIILAKDIVKKIKMKYFNKKKSNLSNN